MRQGTCHITVIYSDREGVMPIGDGDPARDL
jgi:hypothetical protein